MDVFPPKDCCLHLCCGILYISPPYMLYCTLTTRWQYRPQRAFYPALFLQRSGESILGIFVWKVIVHEVVVVFWNTSDSNVPPETCRMRLCVCVRKNIRAPPKFRNIDVARPGGRRHCLSLRRTLLTSHLAEEHQFHQQQICMLIPMFFLCRRYFC